MAKRAPEVLGQQWKVSILKQRESGLSIASWCRQNNIAVHTFYYWRDKLFTRATIDRSDFKEILEQKNVDISNKNSGIFLEYQGISIHIDRQFDPSALKECLKALKEMSC